MYVRAACALSFPLNALFLLFSILVNYIEHLQVRGLPLEAPIECLDLVFDFESA